eukprot:g1953.t1
MAWSQNPWAQDDMFGGGRKEAETSASISTRNDASSSSTQSSKILTIKEATMFLVDCRENMLEKNSEGQTYLDMSLEVIRETLKSNIFRSTNKMHGVLFLGAAKEKNEHQFKGIHKLQGLEQPSARAIKQIEVLMADDGDTSSMESFKKTAGNLPSSAHLPLYDGLWMASLEMSKAKLKSEDLKDIWIFTNDDNPFNGSAAKAAQVKSKAAEMVQEEDYEIELWCMDPSKERPFDSTIFYDSVLPCGEDSIRSSGTSNFDDLIDRVRRKEFRKRCRARVPFRIGQITGADTSPFELGVEVYNCVHFLHKPSATKLEAKNNKPTIVRTKWLCEETAAVLLEHEIKSYHFYGSRRVYFSKAEMRTMKTFGSDQHFRLLGFAHKTTLRSDQSLRSPYFLRPDEFNFPGSGKMFVALYRRMIERSKIAFVAFIPAAGVSSPRVFAMIPQEEKADDDFVDQPAGFNLVALPFKQEIRDVGSEIVQTGSGYGQLPLPTAAQLRTAADIVKKIHLVTFSSNDFENPMLQHHYRTVEALALGNEVEWDPEKDDVVRPDLEKLKEYGEILGAFNEAFTDIEESAPSSSSKAKRKRNAGDKTNSSKNASKKTKVKAESASITWAEIKSKGSVPARITVTQLKALLREKGLSTSGRKSELMSRVAESLS